MFERARVAHGRAATPTYYRSLAARKEVIHIAAHAFADARAPGLAGVVLGSRKGGTGASGRGLEFLSAEDVRAVPIRAGLVTLSACDSGLGLLRAREGTLGLARAFLEAGADSVIATLWPVDDDAAHDLMTAFYRRLCQGEERSHALAHAKRKLRAAPGRNLIPARAHPYFWAAFVLVDHRPDTHHTATRRYLPG